MNRLGLLLRALIIAARDMFIGFILGMCAAVLMAKINPESQRIVALLIPAGIAAGFLKGIAKFVFINLYSALPSKGYRYNYPKYKILFFWVLIFAGVLIYGYGFNPWSWFYGPLQLLQNNVFLGPVPKQTWVFLTLLVSAAGIFSYLYEPPYNPEETLPPQEDL
ncbi:MAG: hypothetical protein CVU89_03925 [Firmicutes bacterium HGW-Firmicutes-14]|nr:MAG: hypothetical protein CVU89_03925 [Firmicutes bacterium HGW-Firmicutes-14]